MCWQKMRPRFLFRLFNGRMLENNKPQNGALLSNDTLIAALKRDKSGTLHHPPVIEGVSFAAFTPTPATWQQQQAQLAAIYKKYAALPYPKPRT